MRKWIMLAGALGLAAVLDQIGKVLGTGQLGSFTRAFSRFRRWRHSSS